MSNESAVLQEIRLAVSKAGARMFRMNTGRAWVGKVIARTPATITLEHPRPFVAGFKGMPDLVGWYPLKITPEMVGKTIAVYTAIEAKDKGRTTPEQERFIAVVRGAGGIAGVARSVEDAVGLLKADAFRP